ncbi:MAG: tRNA (adenosine(37)-N6)-threonylcarbamoyltransferase complex dimerization subunit type 1 TsaB [Candidatus Levybacteria bacterium]|nr:tRNA (adenosine(37)-N6)-threonylcarbamoyltransferase complex dimerization subunit type 1 TsaB [Candidatus Levybacteria bacterium]
MGNILIIDTSSNKKVKIGIETGGKRNIVVSDSKKLKSQTCLLLIEKVLKDNNLSPKDLSKIEVNKGPGSFTGLRVGIAIANTLSYLLKIPVNERKVGEMEEPVYN